MRNRVQSLVREEDLARRRLQKKGEIVNTGGWWKGRWREDIQLPDGTTKYQWSPRVNLLPSAGPFKATKKEAERHFWNAYLSKLDANNLTPHSIETVGGFIESKFDPLHIEYTRRPKWHRSIIRNHFPGWFLEMRLRDVKKLDVQRVCDGVAPGHAPQTVKHVKSRIHKLFEFASDENRYAGRNPARGVRIGPITRKETLALEYEEAWNLLQAIQCQHTKDLVVFALLSGCRISEILGLTWRYVNLNTTWRNVGSYSLPESSAAILKQWYRGGLSPLKTEASTRVIPLSRPMVEILERRSPESKDGPGRFVFAGRTGRPLDSCNLASRKLKPAARSVGLPDASWHCFRHTLNTWLYQEGVPEPERMAQLGHKRGGMNANYLHVRLSDRRPVLEEIAAKVMRNAFVLEPTAEDLEGLREYFK